MRPLQILSALFNQANALIGQRAKGNEEFGFARVP
jgi:hypothetical protein